MSSEFKIFKKFNWQLASNPIEKTAFYEHSLLNGPVINVNTLKGIIEIEAIEDYLPAPDPAFASAVQIYINNPGLNLTENNRDNIYIQLTPYYKPAANDTAIPYLLSNGFVANGLGVQIFNANPAAADSNQWEGKLYLYYEIYNI